MKERFVKDIISKSVSGETVSLLGWIRNRRHHGGLVFLDVCDSTGTIQCVFNQSEVSDEIYSRVEHTPLESSVLVEGFVWVRRVLATEVKEIRATNIKVIGSVAREISPRPRSDIDIFDTALADHLLRNRHLYLRNEKVMAILKFRHILMGVIHQWFRENGFIEITAPVLTPLPLYDDGTAISLNLHGDKVFLTQCVGYYLESAVHAFEKVYNIGPSFRGEESRSRRHLMEYWHIKAELAFGNLEDIISIVESLLNHVVAQCEQQSSEITSVLGTQLCTDGQFGPFPRITYREAIARLNQTGANIQFGKSLRSEEEELLSKDFKTPFWIVGIPRAIEPFPYVIDASDPEVTRTADLIATNGFGELLGVAEKITDLSMLNERMREKGKFGNPSYDWLRDLREYGCVPHIGFGMGVERFIRWLLGIPHVRDTIPFPRTFRRRVQP